jgi:peptidyl-prolyl cis-trans isomerase SurA
MKYTNNLWAIVLCLLPFLTAAQGEGVVVDKIIAKVDNHIILKSDLENAYLGRMTSGEKMNPNERCLILKQLIVNKILFAKAEIDSVIVDDKRVDGELERRMQYFVMQAGGEDKLERTLGKKLSELREELRDQVHEQLTIQEMQQTLMEDVTVSPSQVKRFFNRLPKDSIPFLPAEAKVGQIVKNPSVSRKEKDAARNILLDFKNRILNGTDDFAELARKNSEDAGSARNGGDLGWHGRGELVPEFEAIALRIEPGQIADPIESDFGFHLIQLTERRGNRFRARHILIRPKSNTNDITEAVALLDSVRNLILKDSLKFEQAAKDFSDDQATRANAGYFKDPDTGSSFVPVEDLEPAIFFTIDTMKVGNITKPMVFRNEEGKNAVRIIYYAGYVPPHYANLKEDYQKIALAAMNERREDILEKWLKNAKGEVFIDIDPEYDACEIVNQL